jgi:hypothetical protein
LLWSSEATGDNREQNNRNAGEDHEDQELVQAAHIAPKLFVVVVDAAR